MAGMTVNMVLLPPWTSAILYLRYNYKDMDKMLTSNKFTTWWYFAVTMMQFFTGLAALYLYAYLKVEIETRQREEEIKGEQGKTDFSNVLTIIAQPCGCSLIGDPRDEIIRRYNNMHEIDIRANILCPNCKNRVDFLGM